MKTPLTLSLVVLGLLGASGRSVERPEPAARFSSHPPSPSVAAAPQQPDWPCRLAPPEQRKSFYRRFFHNNRQSFLLGFEECLDRSLIVEHGGVCDLDHNQWLDPEEVEYALELMYKVSSWKDSDWLKVSRARSPGMIAYHAFTEEEVARATNTLSSFKKEPAELRPGAAPDSVEALVCRLLGNVADPNRDGLVDDQELARARTMVLKEYDGNGDGQFNAGELCRLRRDLPRPKILFWSQVMPSEQRRFRGWACHWLFLAANDRNGNGRLDGVVEGRNAEAELMRQFDADHNGWLDLDEQLVVQARIRRTFWPRSMLEFMGLAFPLEPFACHRRFLADPNLRLDGSWWRRATREAVMQFDRNGDGWLDQAELLALATRGQQLKMDAELDQAAWWMLGWMYDADHDGRVSSPQELIDARTRLVGFYDQDGNGALEQEEFYRFYEDRRAFMVLAEERILRACVEEYDLNGDNRMDDEELLPAVWKLARRFDADGNGFLRGEEIAQAGNWVEDHGMFERVKYQNWTTMFIELYALWNCDRDDDGRAGPEELKEASVAVLGKYDVNHDGWIAKSESRAVRRDCKEMAPEIEAAIRKLSRGKFDEDRNGGLNRAEMAAAKQEAMRLYDKDRDGRLSENESEKIEAALREAERQEWQVYAQMERARRKEKLKLYDLDGDGMLNDEEQRRAMEDEVRSRQEQILAAPIDE